MLGRFWVNNKNSNIAIFLGPSLSVKDAKRILQAQYYPPLKRGDISRVIEKGIECLGIIDGTFYHTLSVSSFEILSALREGINVVGASSMGALKAVECSPFGMIGVGKIFEWYQSEKIDAEDEVAITYNSKTFEATSDPLVNMRFAFSKAVDLKIISQKEKQNLLKIANKIYFPQRNYQSVFKEAEKKLFPEQKLKALKKLVVKNECNLKRLDAIACLKFIKKIIKK